MSSDSLDDETINNILLDLSVKAVENSEPEVVQEEENVGEPEVVEEKENVGEPEVVQEKENIGEPEVVQEKENIGEPEVVEEKENVIEQQVNEEIVIEEPFLEKENTKKSFVNSLYNIFKFIVRYINEIAKAGAEPLYE